MMHFSSLEISHCNSEVDREGRLNQLGLGQYEWATYSGWQDHILFLLPCK